HDAALALADAVARETERLRTTPLRHADADWDAAAEVGLDKPDRPATLAQLLARVEVGLDAFERIAGPLTPRLDDPHAHERYRQLVAIESTYAGYFAKQARAVAHLRDKEHVPLPDDLDYMTIGSLKFEARHALERFRPGTIGQASRLAGVTPSDVDVLLVTLRKRG
ncbi:MAG: tRNA uridine-5-carboxymethylaminomethyl(34) synthesis enzyme MnmG, partial [Candidatus Sumerlaeia bacterium]|nr:tRNA uridine-5-carboxymethylaminomethyl(34) synthesis enzyme MnmG [Candidatus Sumerlaeia bacterium]